MRGTGLPTLGNLSGAAYTENHMSLVATRINLMFRYSYIIIDFSAIEDDVQAAFALLKDCGYAGVELNLTPDVLNRLDELESMIAANGLVVPAL